MAENTVEPNEQRTLFQKVFTDRLPIEQRSLIGTLMFFGIILLLGWVAINESARMQTFTTQYEGRSIARGAVLFSQNCATCHGVDGKGLEGIAPSLNAPDLFDGSRLQSVGWAGTLYDYIYLTVSAGRPVRSADWPQAMPTWSQEYGGPMRPDQVRDVVAYVENYGRFYEEGAVAEVPQAVIATPTPSYTPVGTAMDVELPEGDPAHGEALFKGQTPGPDGAILACNSCHSLDGSVLVGPSLQGVSSRAMPAGYDDVELYIKESILQPNAHKVEGFENVNMPETFGQRIDAQTLADLIAFLMTQ
jgi:mono/diheme cytochrome c family protein